MTITPAHYIGEPATVPLHQISTAPQVRTRNGFDEASLSELAASIKALGLQQPIIVERTGAEAYRVLAGERRLIACSMAGLGEIPVLVRPEDTGPTRLAAQAVENLQRVDLALLDQAEAVAELVNAVGQKEAGKMLGKSPAWISKRLAVLRLKPYTRALAEDGTTEDPEILNAMDKIGAISPDTFDALADDLRTGSADRAKVRAELAKLTKKPELEDEAGEGDDEGSEEGASDPEPPAAAKLTLKLTQEEAETIRDALATFGKTSTNERIGIAANVLHKHIRDLINNTFGV